MDPSGGASLPSSCPDARKRRVSYFYEPTIGGYYYGQGHPMKPHRISMAHNLIVHYSLHRRMEINRPFPADYTDIRRFHSQEYVDFLASVSPNTLHDDAHERQLKRFNVGEDCPVFDGLFGFCQASAGGSIGAAVKLNRQDADIAINWAGGLHHAKKGEASGFCYVNDIVLGILELLKVHRRVLYVDIDVHHGDGVEEAFYVTDRVMTVSFHKYGEFFPGTGHIMHDGVGAGKYYALNVPLNDGLNDENFRNLFRPIMQKVMEVYQPDAVVLQCGADSLAGDRLGCFNLSVKGHADCLRFLRSFNVPLMVLGGGGYTIRNVARCWCYETAVAVDVEPDNKLPYNDYYEYFGPSYTLHVEPSSMINLNTDRDLEKIRNTILDKLSKLQHAPSIPFQYMPPTTKVPEEGEEDMEMRPKPRIWDGGVDNESDDDDNDDVDDDEDDDEEEDDENEKKPQLSLTSEDKSETSMNMRGSSSGTVKEEIVTVKEEALTVKVEVMTVKEVAVTVKVEVKTVKKEEEAATVKEEVATVREEVTAAEEEVATVKEEVAKVKEEVATVKEEDTTDVQNRS